MIRLSDIRIRAKLTFFFIMTGIVPLVIVGGIGTYLATQSLLEKSFEQLEAVQDLRKGQLESSFDERLKDLKVMAADQRIQTLTSELIAYRQAAGVEPSEPFPADSAPYAALTAKYQAACREYTDTYGFYSLSIIAVDTGHLMFSTTAESDLGANLSSHRYTDNGKAEAWRQVKKTGAVTVIDFAPYAPSKGQQSAFIAQPVLGNNEQPIGIVVLQFSPSFINEIMDSRKGLGKTGESYLIRWIADRDRFEFRSDMQTMGDGHYTVGSSLDSPPSYWQDAVTAGRIGGKGIYHDSLGKRVLITFDRMNLQGMDWYLVSKIDRQEVLEPLWKIIRDGLAAALVLAFGIAGCSWLYSKGFVRPLAEDVRFAQAISQGQLDQTLTLDQKDEFGKLAQALNEMAGSLREIDWIKRGKEGLHDITRGEHNVDVLARRFIAYFTQHLDAQLGAVYLNNEGMLNLAASYAFTDRSGNFNRVRIGEGMIGQAALEKEVIYFSRVEDAPVLNYGVAEEIPGHFVAAPLYFEENLIGVILIGSGHAFSQLERHFIEENLENSAILLNMARSHQTITELLDHTREQQEVLEMKNINLAAQTQVLRESEAELQAQQEELRVTNEELAEQTRVLKASEAALQAQQDELRVTNEELEERTQALARQKQALKEKTLELIRTQKDVEKKARDLEISSQYKSEFLANMSHELRTPLNSILILSQLFSKNRDGNLTDKQIESAKAIHSSGSELLNLINEILDLSKVEAGKVELVIEETRVDTLLDDLKRVFKDIAAEKKIPLEISLAADIPATILTDSQRLQQILRNLLSNAYKFTQEGTISLDISRPSEDMLQQAGLKSGEALAFAVRDQGIGIPKARQNEIFEAFQQVDGSTSRTYGGTGLGLSISKELTRLLGGRIFLESTEGAGSTFTIVLPERCTAQSPTANSTIAGEFPDLKKAQEPERSRTTKKPQEKAAAGESSLANTAAGMEASVMEQIEGIVKDDRRSLSPGDKSLLIIEDDDKFSAILRDFAREQGFKCIIAENGESGLHFADYYRPSAIILDIGLPGIDGWTVMERLKENPDLRHIPVHFMSAADSSLNAMRMGAIGFLTKPVSIEKIEEAFGRIDTLLAKSLRKLLIVEDDLIQRESIRQLIAGNDIEATTVATGKEAFTELSRGGYDCMILDLGLADMSGFELLEMIRKDERCATVPVIVYTGRELSQREEDELRTYTESIIIKGAKSPERLLDESALFLHRVEANMPAEKQRMLRFAHDKEAVLDGKTVLLVDDDMRNVFALSSVLEEKGLNIIVARNGLESLEKLKDHQEIALVLMDIMMPKMDGYEAMREIRKDARLKKLPIIALTAKAMMGDRAKCIEAGANDYLAKPVDTDKLLSMLRVWLYS